VLVSLLLMIPCHAALNWKYVFNSGLDTMVGCVPQDRKLGRLILLDRHGEETGDLSLPMSLYFS
jgi:hypothetical protein